MGLTLDTPKKTTEARYPLTKRVSRLAPTPGRAVQRIIIERPARCNCIGGAKKQGRNGPVPQNPAQKDPTGFEPVTYRTAADCSTTEL